jgi:hypothetical protein
MVLPESLVRDASARLRNYIKAEHIRVIVPLFFREEL